MTRFATGETELYQLDSDPHEFTNLASMPKYAEVIAKLSQHLSFKHPKPNKDGWQEAEDLPHQSSSDFGQRGNFHYPKDQAGASQGTVVCADLRKGEGSYIEFVVQIEEAGEYEVSIVLSAQGLCSLSTAAVVDDAGQADVGFPMKQLLSIKKSKAGVLDLVSAGNVRFDQVGLHLLRFSSEVKKQVMLIDRIQVQKQ